MIGVMRTGFSEMKEEMRSGFAMVLEKQSETTVEVRGLREDMKSYVDRERTRRDKERIESQRDTVLAAIQSLLVSGHDLLSVSIGLPVMGLVKQKQSGRALSRAASSGVLPRSPRPAQMPAGWLDHDAASSVGTEIRSDPVIKI